MRRRPSIRLPLVELRSEKAISRSLISRRACARDTRSSSSTMVLSGLRPMVTSLPTGKVAEPLLPPFASGPCLQETSTPLSAGPAGGGYAEGLVDEVAEASGRPRVAGIQGMQLVEPALDVSDRAAAIDEHDLAAMLLRQLAQHAVVAVDHYLEDGVLHRVGDLLRQQARGPTTAHPCAGTASRSRGRRS